MQQDSVNNICSLASLGEEHNFAALRDPLGPGGSVMGQQELKKYIQVKRRTVTDAVLCLVTQLCPAVCEPIDCSPPGFSVHGILQAGILEWNDMTSSRGSS